VAEEENKMLKAVYGPVPSWRLGRSLGVDPVCNRKVCSFDCVYCQLGKTTELAVDRRTFVKTAKVRKDLEEAWERIKGNADVVTLSGTGEPELAENLGELISIAGEVTGLKVAVLTNSSLMDRKDVRRDLAGADIVVAKLDAPDADIFGKINRPHPSVNFGKMLEGMRKFRKEFTGKYALQMMFMDSNKNHAEKMKELAEGMEPDEIQIDTPLRPSPSGECAPLGREEIEEIKKAFQGMKYISVYDIKRPHVDTLDRSETSERRPEKK